MKHLFFRCCCGRPKSEHHIESSGGNKGTSDNVSQDQIWDPNKHLKEDATNAYGEVVFEDTGTKLKAKV